MFTVVRNWFTPKANPIGIDFGTESLRLAQVQRIDNEFHLVAAASADVPAHVRHDPAARFTFFTDAVRDLLAQGRFRSRQCVLGLPACNMVIQHLRLPRMDSDAMRKAIPWEARGKLPFDPSRALIRHIVAGDIYQDQEPRSEVILMAAHRETVEQYLAAASRARLDVLGMNVEPKALVDCFGHVYRRKTDAQVTNCFVDIGSVASRAVIARGGQILFARIIPIGGDHFTRAVASALDTSLENARLLRYRLAQPQADADNTPDPKPLQAAAANSTHAFPLLDAALEAHARHNGESVAVMTRPDTATVPLPAAILDPARQVEQACRDPLLRLTEELDLCRRYYESAFPDKPVDRLIFVGGEAAHRTLCQHIARELQLAAQIGDPMLRMARLSHLDSDSGIDRRLPQPAWAVALGLSMGSAMSEELP